MPNYSNPALIWLRTVGQNIGILRPTVRLFRRLFNLSYESNFDKEMMKQISVGEIVWDIGANIGYFSKKYSEKVGQAGLVYAFEPARHTHTTLVQNCQGHDNITCKNIALSDKSGYLSFRESGVENDPTNGLVADGTPGAVTVEVTTADELVASKAVPVPNVVKIDVEGFEVEVIRGMRAVLKDPALKKMFVEVHFLEMSKRGLTNGPTEIVDIISKAGLTVKWTDPSHFIASRA